MPIPFNKPYFTGKESAYINQALIGGKISGDGPFTQRCHRFFCERYGFKKVLLTTSCTDALEMSALLIDTQAGDEIIMPSYTFVSTANAFVLRGAKIVFADSSKENPNIDVTLIEALITPKTKAIVVVHYAGVACDMEAIMALAAKYNLFVIEDAAQGIDSFCNGKPLGSIGHLGAFSFHDTKNIIAGEGGMLLINDDRFMARAEIIREKGTNRAQFLRGEVDKYSWVDVGSSFLPSDMIAACLLAQLEHIDDIQQKRKKLWQFYYEGLIALQEAGKIRLPQIPAYATNNAQMFYVLCANATERSALIASLKEKGIQAVFHYLSLHNSAYYSGKHDGRKLEQSDYYSNALLRLPLYYDLSNDEQQLVVKAVADFYKK